MIQPISFIWDPEQDQSYDYKYGSQTVTNGYFGKSSGARFLMRADNLNLTLRVTEGNNNTSIKWEEGSAINVESGTFKYDFSYLPFTYSTQLKLHDINISGSKNASSIVEIVRPDTMEIEGEINIGHSGTLIIKSMKNNLNIASTDSTINLIGDALLRISSDINASQDIKTVIDNDMFLIDDSYAEIKTPSLSNLGSMHYRAKDNTTLVIYTDEISSDTFLEFEIGSGTPKVSIQGLVNPYCRMSTLGKEPGNAFPFGRFNFMTKDGQNSGLVYLCCEGIDPEDGTLTTDLRTLKKWLEVNDMLCIDRQPATLDKFSIQFDDKSLKIMLK